MAVRVADKPSKKGYKYFFDCYYVVDGKKKRHRSGLYQTRKEAKQAEVLFLLSPSKKKSICVNEVIDSYINSKNWRKTTRVTNLNKIEHIRAFFGNYLFEEITPAACKAFLKRLDNHISKGKSLSARYKNAVLLYLKSICRYAEIYYGVTAKAPFGLKPYPIEKPPVSIFSEDDFKRFIGEVKQPVYRALFVFLMYTGCRSGEALALRFTDIDFEKKTFTISKSFSQLELQDVATKTASSVRTLPLSKPAYDSCLAMLALYKADKRFKDDWRVFGGRKHIPDTTLTRIKNKACKAAGLPQIRIHDFRHSFITMLMSSGADISTVSHYVGHAEVSTTLNVYSHFYETKLKALIDNL